ncbi:tetratricopeptide repeat protein [Candidatus Sumerlaeota bacterium]|nr:tetratricopeptide repeat protein [Candidatus Sumerlaeota bacterium]
MGDELYAPIHVACHWLAGLTYLGSVLYCLRFLRRPRIAFLLVSFFSVAILFSLVPPQNLWSNIHYAGQSVVPAIVLSAWVGDRLLARRTGRATITLLLVCLTVAILLFLSGPPIGYFTPDKEKAYVGKVFYHSERHKMQGGLTADDLREIRELTDETIRTRPNSLIAQYYRAFYARSLEERLDALAKANRIDPHSSLVALYESQLLDEAGDTAAARRRLRETLGHGEVPVETWKRLANLEYKLGNYDEAAACAERVARAAPGSVEIYLLLFLIYDAQGRVDKSGEAFDALQYWLRKTPSETCLVVAQEFVTRGRSDKAAPYIEEAFRLDPGFPQARFALGALLNERGEFDRAAQLFEEVLRAKPDHAQARAFLDQIRRKRQNPPPPPPARASNRPAP